MIEQSIEDFIFEFIDQCKLLFFPEKWNNTFMDYSKNELFAMLLVHRKGHVNMTEIADFLGAPLNTATGIISRLEKRGIVKRERDIIDKRVVTIGMTDIGKEFLAEQLQIANRYYQQFLGTLSEEEKLVLIRLVSKFLDIATQDLLGKDLSLEKNKNVKRITIE